VNDSGTIGPGPSGTIDAVGAGNRVSHLGDTEGREGKREYHRCPRMVHQQDTFLWTGEPVTGIRVHLKPIEILLQGNILRVPYCGGNVAAATFVTGGGFHFPIRASLFGA